MPVLKYAGPQPVGPNDVATFEYVESVLATGMSTVAVNDRINANLAGKVLKSYVDAQDALLATPAYMNAADATKLKVAQRGAANGVLDLGPTGRALPARFNVSPTQRWASGVWTPSAYSGAITGITSETTVYPMTVSDPGYAYKILVFGMADANTNLDGEYPIIQVRQGSTSGTVIAEGRGAADNYLYTTGMNGGDDFERVDLDYIGTSLWQTSYSVGSTGRGYDAIPQGHEAEWQVTGAQTGQALHRRIHPADRYTDGNDQMVTLTQGIIPSQTQFFGELPVTYVICRMSEDFQNMVLLAICGDDGGHRLRWYRHRNGNSDQVGPTVAITQGPGVKWAVGAQGTTYTAYRNNAPVSSWPDTGGESLIGSTTRGWGWGHQAGYRNFPANTQSRPASVASVRISDHPTLQASAGINIFPVNFASQGVHTGPTQLFVRANRSGSAASVGVSAFSPKLVAYTVPA